MSNHGAYGPGGGSDYVPRPDDPDRWDTPAPATATPDLRGPMRHPRPPYVIEMTYTPGHLT
ncbi:hypothetical protein ACJBCE_36615 [Streptomyces sp. NBUL23]|uniref:hypothetical protein n=1 Tax=Streptomyces sp. NBUL23 TaxID=3381354 RepID=UPI0038720CA6